ncbi:hypothetical protein CVS40_11228 [Lucilia cuprina]|nr:hypothetical protein CVS40_11228 [Lucilia cuprina]
MSTIRRWDLTYDGDEHLMEFIERLEELAECYNFTRSRLLFELLEILKGRALQWYRLKRNEIDSWAIFKDQAIRFFLPKRHLSHLEEAIYLRKQGSREKAKDYIMTLQTWIRQHPELRMLNHTDRIYDGLRCEYKLYVRRTDFKTIDELMELTDKYELLRREISKQSKPQPSHYMGPTSVAAPYEQHNTCFRCKQQGHFRSQCTNSCRLFCSRCGKDGVFSLYCPCGLANQEVRNDGRYYLMITVNNLFALWWIPVLP